jgi:uncharacterized cupin superfamily protein
MPSDNILVEKHASPMKLEVLGAYDWPIWKKEISSFPWTYHRQETCFFVRGKVIVTPDNGEPISMGRGDLVTFPKGLQCTWEILQDVEKHYILDE